MARDGWIKIRIPACALAFALLAGCALAPAAGQLPAATGETILLVSLEDGTIVRQTVDLGAELCIKEAAASMTTCLSRGEPVFNESGTLVGYEMHSDVIDLYSAE